MLIVAIAASAFGSRIRALQRQEEAFRQISAKGGEILVRVEGTSIYFCKRDGFLCGTGLKRVIESEGSSASLHDVDVDLLDSILNLRHVNFQGTAVSASRIESFEKAYPQCHVSK